MRQLNPTIEALDDRVFVDFLITPNSLSLPVQLLYNQALLLNQAFLSILSKLFFQNYLAITHLRSAILQYFKVVIVII